MADYFTFTYNAPPQPPTAPAIDTTKTGQIFNILFPWAPNLISCYHLWILLYCWLFHFVVCLFSVILFSTILWFLFTLFFSMHSSVHISNVLWDWLRVICICTVSPNTRIYTLILLVWKQHNLYLFLVVILKMQYEYLDLGN